MNAWEVVLMVLAVIGYAMAAYALRWLALIKPEIEQMEKDEALMSEHLTQSVLDRWSLNQDNAKLNETIRQLQRNISELKHEVEQTPPF